MTQPIGIRLPREMMEKIDRIGKQERRYLQRGI